MNVIAILIPLGLLIASMGLMAFFWALKTKQFEDPEGSARRILSDDDLPDHDLPDDDRPDEASPDRRLPGGPPA